MTALLTNAIPVASTGPAPGILALPARTAGHIPADSISVCAEAALLAWCVLLSVIDLRERRLPNILTGTGALSILGFAVATGRGAEAVAGALLLALPYLACHLIAPAAIGAGDMKLAVGLGGAAACGGTQAWVWAAITAPVLTAVVGVGYLIPRRHGVHRLGILPRRNPPPGLDTRASPADSAVPHGPSMCLSTVAALLLAH